MEKFAAWIYKVDINPCVDIPKRVIEALLKQAGRKKSPVPVRGKINGADFQTTIVKFRGKWRLYLNGDMRKRSGTDVGDLIHVELVFDHNPPEYPMPKELARALAANLQAKRAFEKLTFSRQKEIIRYLASLKTKESLDRNIKKLIKEIL